MWSSEDAVDLRFLAGFAFAADADVGFNKDVDRLDEPEYNETDSGLRIS